MTVISGGSHPLDLAAIRARVAAATAGPWHGEHDEFGCVSQGDYGWVCPGPSFPAYDVDSEQGKADAEFIAHARTDVPLLLAEVERLTAELAEAKQLAHQRDEARARVHFAHSGEYRGCLRKPCIDWQQAEAEPAARAEAAAVIGRVVEALDAKPARDADAELAVIERRVAADKRVLDAARAWRADFRSDLKELADDAYWPTECALFAAVDALVEEHEDVAAPSTLDRDGEVER
jgi:hypothetical protein